MPAMMKGKILSVFTRPWPGIGDAAYCALLARELKARFPGGRVVCYSAWPQLFKHDPNIAEAHPVDADHHINPVLPKRWREHNGHISENMCQAMGFDLEGSVRIPYYMSKEEEEWARGVLDREGARVVIHARQRKKFGSNKDWPPDRWAELVAGLGEPAIQVGDGEPAVPGARDYRGRDIRQSLALVALSKVFVTCDSGLYHAASGFTGKRNVVLLGERSHPSHFTYPGDAVFTGHYNCPKKHCDEAHCPLVPGRGFAPCMLSISAREALDAVLAALRAEGPRA